MATLPVARRPEAEVGPSWAPVERKPLLKGLWATMSARSSPAFSKQASEKSRLLTAEVSTSSEHSRTAVQ